MSDKKDSEIQESPETPQPSNEEKEHSSDISTDPVVNSAISASKESSGEVQTAASQPQSISTGTNDGTLPKSNKQKIDILLKATGNAPIMKKKKWTVEPDKKIGSVISFVRRYLKLDSQESLFLYINQAFAPAPDQTVRNMYECYGTDGTLVLHYCKSPAWG